MESIMAMGGVSSKDQKECKIRIQRYEEWDLDSAPKYFKGYLFMGDNPTFCKMCDNGGLITVALIPYPHIGAFNRTDSVTFSRIEETTAQDFEDVYNMCMAKINDYNKG